MARKQFTPPTIEEVEAYVRANNFIIDPEDWLGYFADNDWIDSEGKPVKNWKGKLRTHHNFKLTKGTFGSCCVSKCRNIGVRVIGKDGDGHIKWACLEHRNQKISIARPVSKVEYQPVLPKELTDKLLRYIDEKPVDVNERRNLINRQLRVKP